MSEIFTQLEKDLRLLYYDWEGKDQFKGTGERVSRMMQEFCWPSSKINEELGKCFEAVFLDSFDEMLVSGPTITYTLCPHHLLPCKLTVYIGYIPDKEVLGLSKFSRVAEILSRRPILQEMYCRDVIDTIKKRLGPRGLGVHVIGEHGCMRARGVRQEAKISTSVLDGIMKDHPEARAEFYAKIANIGGTV